MKIKKENLSSKPVETLNKKKNKNKWLHEKKNILWGDLIRPETLDRWWNVEVEREKRDRWNWIRDNNFYESLRA